MANSLRSSGTTYNPYIAKTQPWSSAWMPPAMDPLRVWPDEYDPAVENAAWANDPLGPWGGIKPYMNGVKRDSRLDPGAFNYC